jgi:uncharacterized protein
VTREETIEALRGFFAKQHGFAAAYLFGSVARGEHRAGSDVDVGLLRGFSTGRLADLETPLQQALEQLLATPVDLVVLDRAPPDLGHRVLREGLLLADPNPSRRIAWEVRVRAEYFDLLPTLELIRRTPERLR